MKTLKPFIKYYYGKPIALCNRCFVLMCHLSCEATDSSPFEKCVIIDRRFVDGKPVISALIGELPPLYCDECNKLLQDYCLN